MVYICTTCSFASQSKLGKCPDCWSFGTFEQDLSKGVSKSKATKKHHLKQGSILDKSVKGWTKSALGNIHYILKNTELSRIFPVGINQSGVYLLAGEPWIGKSTIMLQILHDLSQNNEISIAYFSGEETPGQIEKRSERILSQGKAVLNFDVYHTTHLEDIVTTAESQGYDLIVIDSIQTIYSESIDGIAGSPSQVKQCSEKLSEYCKDAGTTCFIVGHVTKEGEIAWPKYLEHIVDVVLYLEGDRYGQYRFLRCRKNRFGPTDEVGIFEMGLFGLQAVNDLKDRIISAANTSIPGNVLTVGIDNGRPVLINLEVLLNKTFGKYPQRISQWVDNKRVQLITAIVERYLKVKSSYFDIYVNIPGEFQFRDNGLDLAIAAAIYSQSKWTIIDKEIVFIGELGLGGQVLPAKLHKKRVSEAKWFTIIDHTRIKNIVELPNAL